MHPCAAYLDEVEALLDREKAALASDDGEALDECAERRLTALSLAWELRQGYEIALLRRRLSDIQKKQTELDAEALAAREELRASLTSVRKQSGYFAGNRRAVALSQKATHFNTVS